MSRKESILNKFKQHAESKIKSGKITTEGDVNIDKLITTRKRYNNQEESHQAKKQSKRDWQKKDPEKTRIIQKQENKKHALKKRYLIEKYHKEIGLKIREFKIINKDTGQVVNPYIIECLSKLGR